MAYRILSMLLVTFLLGACGGDKCADAADCGAGAGGEGGGVGGAGGGPPQGCEPGAALYCKCPDGTAGSRVCSAEGTAFGECRLTSGDPCP
jgi:hypothetical protein